MERKKSQNPDPPKTGGSATRKGKGSEKCNIRYRVDDVQQWYYSGVKQCQLKKRRKGVPPALNAGKTEMHFEGHPTGVDVTKFALHMVDTIKDAASGRAAQEKDRVLP
jgi:hypothetical protein